MTEFEFFIACLPEWDGRDRVSELETRVKTKITFYEEKKHETGYIINFARLLKECCSDNRNRIIFLTLAGKQGIGKSTFARWLFPFSYSFTEKNRSGLGANDVVVIEEEEYSTDTYSPYINDIVCEIFAIDYSYTNIDIKQLYAQVLTEQKK